MKIKAVAKRALRYPLEFSAARWGKHTQHQSEPGLWILMYHRILPQTDSRFAQEEPGMVVTPATLEMHLRTIKSYFEIVSLGDWLQRRQQGKPLPPKACAITFDDGWLDNVEYAFPVLQQQQVPATIFVVSHMLGTNQQFWPNRIAKLLQQPAGQLAEITWLSDIIGSGAINRESQAQAIYQLKSLADDKIIALLDAAEESLGITSPSQPSLMSWSQATTLTASGLVEIGSHTRYHIRLRDNLPDAVVQREICESKTRIEQELQQPVRLFCYPNGDWSKAARECVGQQYLGAVTTAKGINHTHSDARILHRFGVHEDATNTQQKLLARLSNWPRL